MRTIKVCALVMTLAFAGMMISSTASAASARSRSTAWTLQDQQPATPQQATPQQPAQDQSTPQEAAPNAQGQEPTAQLFAGKITQQNGEYVLYVAASKTTYKLDDQAKAKQFNGQDVKVQGVLDASSNTIKVADIQPASAAQ